MVEQEAVNFEAAGSSPASGAKQTVPAKSWGFLFAFCEAEPRTGGSVIKVKATFAQGQTLRKLTHSF